MKKALLMLTGALAAVGLASAFGLGTAQVAPAAPVAQTAPAPLYITGDGDFENGSWDVETPGEFELVDGNYVITVDNLSMFKISTQFGDWDTFNAYALTCDYGTKPGVEVALVEGDSNIKCPAKANWTVTVAGDLSTIKLTTEGEVVIVPIEDTPIYLRGDMNGWQADEDWRLTKLGKDSEGAWVYSYDIPETASIAAGESFKFADETWAKINIGGGYGEPIMLDAETEVFNGGNPANLSVEEDVTGVVYLKMNFTDNLGLIYLTNDKEAPCPFPYEGYVAPDPDPTPGPEPGGDHLYITGDGDFENGAWEVATPAEFELVDGNYLITVDNLSQFKISTGYGDWDTFNAYALTCDYGTEQGVEVALVQGDANIMCPVKATWTITVAEDLSTIKLTTDEPVVVVPVEDEPIYLRGDMNGWTADETWKFTKLGKDSEGVVYAYACGLTGITAGDAFKIADANWARINFGGEYTDLIALENETQLAAGSNYNLMAEEDVTGKVYVKLNFTDNTGLIYLTNDKEAPCPFSYEGYVAPGTDPTPEPGEGHLYIIGDGDFVNGSWDVETPAEFELVDGQYVLTVDNLSMFKISTAYGDWDTFNAYALTCDYGTEQGVEVPLVQGDANIVCPVKATWTITVAEDLSTIKLTTDDPIVIVPVEDIPLYLRGDMNAWEASEDWKLTKLGKDSEGARIYSYTIGETPITAGDSFKVADENWNVASYGGDGDYIGVYAETPIFNALTSSAQGNLIAGCDVEGKVFVKINDNNFDGLIYLTTDKEAACPFPYEGYVPPTPEPGVDHLYITGDGDFENGAWDPATPAEFEFVDGNYVITVDNLSTFKISTACGDWDTFNAAALYCDYGNEPGVKVALTAGDANILCPVKAKWTVTVAADLSTVMLTTDQPIVITPIEELPIYLRGDMNGWAASDEWKMTLLGKAADGTAVYSYTFGETGIAAKDSFKIAVDDWSKINIGAADEALGMEVVTYAVNGGNPQNFVAPEEITGVIYLQMNYNTNEGAVFVSNINAYPCPFDYEGRPEAGPVKVSVSVSDGTAFGYTTKFGEETQFDVSVADEYWKFVSFTLNGTEQQLAEPAPIVSLSFPAAFINNYVFTAEYAGTLEVVEHSGVVELSNKLTVTVADDTVEISGLQTGTQVAVYTLGGQTIMTRVAADEVMSIRLDKGQTYIVRAGDAAVKVIL